MRRCSTPVSSSAGSTTAAATSARTATPGVSPNGGSNWLSEVVKVDLETRERSSWSEAGCWPGEPVFVGRPGAESEDDGVLLSVVLDAAAERSFLLVLDASDLRELARAEAPHHIPFGFHGQFARG